MRSKIARMVRWGAVPRLGGAVRNAIATEWDRGTTFLFTPVFLAAGALVYFSIDSEPSFAELGSSVLAIAFVTWLARSRLVLHLILSALLCFALGMTFAKVETWRAGTRILAAEISTRLTGRVALIEQQANGRIRLTVDVLATERPKLKYVPERVRVSAQSIPAGLRVGETVVGVARLVPPAGPTRPGGYDFSFANYFNGIGANGFFFRPPQRVAESPPADMATRFFALVENLRAGLGDRIRTAIDGEAEGEIAAALIAGVRAGIPDDVNEALRRTGLAHVLSISGLHMAIVAGTIMTALRAGFALFPSFASRRPVKKYAAGAAILALGIYLFISGFSVAAERSFLMIGIMLVAVIFDRAALSMRNLAISAIVIIAVSPHEVAGPSFQMSFAATAALIGAYTSWSERRRGPPAIRSDQGLLRSGLTKIIGHAVGLAATSLVAGTATAVYGAYHFQRVSPLSVVANLAAMPIVSAIVMPFAVFGMILMPFGLDKWAFLVMGKGLTAMIVIAEWISDVSPIDGVGLVPASAVAVLTAALIAATVSTTWLRLVAVPLTFAGLAIIMERSLPEALISEDARLLTIRTDDGALAVNRMRPNGFTIEDWQRALGSEVLTKPKNVAIEDPRQLAETGEEAFNCAGNVCVAYSVSAAQIVHVSTAAEALPFCAIAQLIVIDDATAENPCLEAGPTVLTKRDLARRGSASVSFQRRAGQMSAEIDFAISKPYRPWHTHRAFAREARGLAPYERQKPTEAAAQPKATTANTVPASLRIDNEAADDPAASLSSGGSARPAGPAP
ncbi:ComEC/Rec2 family competence protein [Mesorhizobium sp. BAC0120]|uniref:ComEC/Rec2 family competence protein n=1 Tax=Mesorhizobium sp. BAC0120 TaxID=3090670 RepID=UPI00298BD675|nr:ComEC/Rec2 family competence protein [Mesorhizobium sp. BAC0120]MDW6022828.1 ComEC/Rec2 family competence protein [Mesorhizobium sp. BAC0120]